MPEWTGTFMEVAPGAKPICASIARERAFQSCAKLEGMHVEPPVDAGRSKNQWQRDPFADPTPKAYRFV